MAGDKSSQEKDIKVARKRLLDRQKGKSMKTKSFQSYLETRFNKDEIAEIERQAELEVKYMQQIQKIIIKTLDDYTTKNKIGFNDLVKKLDWSP